MGLDTTHDCFHGPYSSFMRFRVKVAKAIGVPLPIMEGFVTYDFTDNRSVYADFYSYKGENMTDRERVFTVSPAWPDFSVWIPMPWSALRRDPLHRLLKHSDCEGRIAWRYTLKIAERLEEIAPDLDEEYCVRELNTRQAALQFAKGMREAHKAHEAVGFH